MITSVHIADLPVRQALALVARPPKAERIAGLRHIDVANTVRFNRSPLPAIQPTRVALVGFWDDEASLDRFLADDPIGSTIADGWSARLEPLRAHGSYPGLPADTPSGRSTDYDGPSVVLTLGRVQTLQIPRFLRTSAPAEQAVIDAPGSIWATALTRPPFVGTCSLWESTEAISRYAYGRGRPQHSAALDEWRTKGFHHVEAYIRFRPVAMSGSLGGRNPLPANAFV